MAYSETLANKIRIALSHLRKVKEKKMFGGLAFIVDNKMCLTAGADRIMCRIDPAVHEEAIKKKGVKTVQMKGRDYKGFVYVSEDALTTKKELARWIDLALDFNKRAKASAKKKKPAA